VEEPGPYRLGPQSGPPVSLVGIDYAVEDLGRDCVDAASFFGGASGEATMEFLGNPQKKLFHAPDDITYPT
jgi:hypothetical protein